MLKNKSKSGFTLAEILITLTVIGVVAALTIPTLLQNTNQAELKTALKRDFADLQQVALLIKNDAGGSYVNAFRSPQGNGYDSENLKNAFKNKLGYIKECHGVTAFGSNGSGASGEGCWHPSNTSKFLNGNYETASYLMPGLVLNNGTLITFQVDSSNCATNVGEYTRCAQMALDVNGFKAPNVYGKDMFLVNLEDINGLLPCGARGWGDPLVECVPGSTDNANRGQACTALYLYQ